MAQKQVKRRNKKEYRSMAEFRKHLKYIMFIMQSNHKYLHKK